MTTIVGLAQGNPAFSTLVATLGFIDGARGTDYVGTLNDAMGPDFTVFAPTNTAFAALAQDLGFAGDPQDEAAVVSFLQGLGAELLETVVTYHVAPGALLAADVASGDPITTLQGGTIGTMDLPTLVDAEPDLADPSLVTTDLIASNGVVHAIDRVLLPVDLPDNDALSITGIVLQSGTGFDANSGDFDILREAVVTADLATALDDATADLTVFAPTDAAFVNLAQTLGFDGTEEGEALAYLVDALRLLSVGADPVPLLETVLLYHAAGESLQASQVIEAGTVTTLQGGEFTLDGLSLVDADPDLPDPALIATDIQASNGIVHVIDNVLLPVDLLASDGANDVDFIIDDLQRSDIKTGRDGDFIDGQRGADTINAGSGDDVVLGGRGHDFLIGGKGEDMLKGEGGRDTLSGRNGADTIDGGAGSDLLRGGHSDDVLIGGEGNDRLVGGKGADVFVFAEDGSRDVVVDFEVGTDKVDLTAFGFEDFAALKEVLGGGDTRVKIEVDHTIIVLRGTPLDTVTQDDFLL